MSYPAGEWLTGEKKQPGKNCGLINKEPSSGIGRENGGNGQNNRLSRAVRKRKGTSP